jgi:hypothetical protein
MGDMTGRLLGSGSVGIESLMYCRMWTVETNEARPETLLEQSVVHLADLAHCFQIRKT